MRAPVIRHAGAPLRTIRDFLFVPGAVWRERVGERLRPLLGDGLSPVAAVDAAVDWLLRAQDRSASADGGVARHYSLVTGWGASYPETTGYIVPTLLAYARWRGRDDVADRAQRMLDWLLTLQFPEGGFPGGVVGQQPCVPVTFNTGQILLGLSAGASRSPACAAAARRAADWLVRTQDADGCWRRHPTPFAVPGEKAYETHVAWGLLAAARATGVPRYAEAALANVRWALGHQRSNGWFDHCCLEDRAAPLTHTIGYALRGVVEAYRHRPAPEFLAAARRTADGLLGALRDDGFLPGRLDAGWRGTVRWACLTGTVQIAACWFLLAAATGDTRYRAAATRATAFVRRTIAASGPEGVRGGVKGSFPVGGAYGRFQFLSWAAKFFVDAQLLEIAGPSVLLP